MEIDRRSPPFRPVTFRDKSAPVVTNPSMPRARLAAACAQPYV
jgi:hypothetical protein